MKNGAGGRNRTDTLSPEPDFESGASTSSATPAKADAFDSIEQAVSVSNPSPLADCAEPRNLAQRFFGCASVSKHFPPAHS
ncbi:hypothetical protein MPC4_30048 [Methylocella tundrae]|uniref:Uncharacterized protein n=1 Tax=Methylocella tundrae TaxID=227605 RepID=A0A8B6M9Z0_METTU|nr:hypothetical protein MPC1_3940002 [Methylocella tundrae]VTZ50864.1 hypothetical protein MPC4_30048 [Methylocella tundrae]